MITDDEIKEYSIKTNPSTIIHKYNNHNKRRKISIPLFSTLFVACAGLVLFLVLSLRKVDSINQINVDNATLNFQVESLVSIICHDNSNIKLANNVTDEDYQKAIDDYKVFEDIIYDKYNKVTPNLDYQYGEFKGSFGTYELNVVGDSYEMMINYKNKKEDESEFFGEIIILDNVYSVSGSEEREEDELELKIKIYISEDEYYSVSEEYEEDEYSYKFKIKSKNKDAYSYKLKIEEEEIKLEVEQDGIKTEYKIEVLSNSKWEIKYNTEDLELKFYMIIDEFGKKRYEYTNKTKSSNAI